MTQLFVDAWDPAYGASREGAGAGGDGPAAPSSAQIDADAEVPAGQWRPLDPAPDVHCPDVVLLDDDHRVLRPCSFAFPIAGNNNDARIAIIAITTNNSINVNPPFPFEQFMVITADPAQPTPPSPARFILHSTLCLLH